MTRRRAAAELHVRRHGQRWLFVQPMNSVHFLLVFPGLMAGLLVWTRIGHLFLAIVSVRRGTNPPAVKEPAPLEKQLLLALFVIGSWAVAFGGVSFYLREHSQSVGWFWFFLGMAATPCVILPTVWRVWQRARGR